MRNLLKVAATLVIGLTLTLSALAAIYGPSVSITPPGRNSLSFAQLLDSQGDYLEFNRGVLMQSFANFQDSQGRIVQPSDVSIKLQGAFPNFEACLQIGNDNCARFLLPLTQLKALLRFIEAKRFLAFTLPSDGPNPERIIQKIKQFGMVKVGDNYEKSDWVAEELAIPELVEAFRYIDFDDPFPFSSAAFERAVAEKYRREVNESLKSQRPSFFDDLEDESWFNSDLNANFVALAHQGAVVCKGLPARYVWELAKGQRFAYVTEIRFAAPRIRNAEHERLYTQAQTLFCTTAIIRSLKAENPTTLNSLK